MFNEENHILLRSRLERRVFWSQHREQYIEEAYAYVASYPFDKHPEYRSYLEEGIGGYMQLLFWIAYQIIQNTEQAHDCVMDALKNACLGIQRYEPSQAEQLQVLPWMKRIVANKARDVFNERRKLMEESLEQMIEEFGTDDALWHPLSRERVAEQPESTLLHQDACRRLKEIFALLPERQAYAIRSHFLYERGHRVAGDVFGISEKGANMLSSRGIKTLREAVLKAGLRLNDFYAGDFEGMLTQILTGLDGEEASTDNNAS